MRKQVFKATNSKASILPRVPSLSLSGSHLWHHLKFSTMTKLTCGFMCRQPRKNSKNNLDRFWSQKQLNPWSPPNLTSKPTPFKTSNLSQGGNLQGGCSSKIGREPKLTFKLCKKLARAWPLVSKDREDSSGPSNPPADLQRIWCP